MTTTIVPIREVAQRRLALPPHDKWVSDLDWVPVSQTEFHLSARYFPLAVRLFEGKPCLGLLVGERYLTRPLVDESGKWQGAYRPIALRCFPFMLRELGTDPMKDLLIARDSPYLSDAEGMPFVDANGQPAPTIVEIHRLFRVLLEARVALAPALDQLLIGHYLVPLDVAHAGAASKSSPPIYVVDRNHFLQAGNAALAAMARQRFLSVDVAVAGLFSQELLRREYLPKAAATATHKMQTAAATPAMRSVQELIGIDDFALVLDDGELISLTDVETMRVDQRQRAAGEPAAPAAAPAGGAPPAVPPSAAPAAAAAPPAASPATTPPAMAPVAAPGRFPLPASKDAVTDTAQRPISTAPDDGKAPGAGDTSGPGKSPRSAAARQPSPARSAPVVPPPTITLSPSTPSPDAITSDKTPTAPSQKASVPPRAGATPTSRSQLDSGPARPPANATKPPETAEPTGAAAGPPRAVVAPGPGADTPPALPADKSASAVPAEPERTPPAPAGTAGRATALGLRKWLEANPPAPQGRRNKAAPPAAASQPPPSEEKKPADTPAPPTGAQPAEKAAPPAPTGTGPGKNVSPQISDMIRKLNELQALLRLD